LLQWVVPPSSHDLAFPVCCAIRKFDAENGNADDTANALGREFDINGTEQFFRVNHPILQYPEYWIKILAIQNRVFLGLGHPVEVIFDQQVRKLLDKPMIHN